MGSGRWDSTSWASTRATYSHAAKPLVNHIYYTNEFAFRLSEGNVRRHTLDRLESLTLGTAGKRLTYKGLIQ